MRKLSVDNVRNTSNSILRKLNESTIDDIRQILYNLSYGALYIIEYNGYVYDVKKFSELLYSKYLQEQSTQDYSQWLENGKGIPAFKSVVKEMFPSYKIIKNSDKLYKEVEDVYVVRIRGSRFLQFSYELYDYDKVNSEVEYQIKYHKSNNLYYDISTIVKQALRFGRII